jgi:hypothetical protein
MYASSVIPTAALGFGDSKIARRTGATNVNPVTLLRARVDIHDAGDNHARLEHAQLADCAAADELSSGREQRFAKCFLQWAQSRIEVEVWVAAANAAADQSNQAMPRYASV